MYYCGSNYWRSQRVTIKEDKQITRLVRTLRSGQITIPVEFRKRLGLTDGSLIQMTLKNGELRITPVQMSATAVGSPWLKELYEYFAPVRAEAIEKGYTEEEINAAIDEAVAAVRKKEGQIAKTEQTLSRQMTDEQMQQTLAAVAEAKHVQADQLAKRGGKRFSPAWELLNEARDQRSRDLA